MMASVSILQILKILEEHSDSNNPLSKNQFCDLFSDKYGEQIDDKQFYRGIRELQKYDYDIVKTRGRYSNYYLGSVDF